MKFSDRYIKKLKPREKRFEVLEGNGLTLMVYPSGVKTFFYVFKMDGKNHRLRLGTYPHCSLGDARNKHGKAWAQRRNGINPVLEHRRANDERLKAPTIKQLANDYLEKYAKVHKRSWKNDEQILEKDVLPAWGDRKAEDIRKRDVIALLEAIVDRGAPNQSGQVLKIVRRMMNWAVERDILESSPCHLVKPLAPAVKKERALTAEEIRTFWRALDADGVRIADSMRRGLRLILVTGQRPGECLGMVGEELDGKWWTLPPERTKNKREHRLWLSPLALELIGSAPESGPVFPAPPKKDPETGEILPPGIMDKAAPARAVSRMRKPRGKEKTPLLTIPPFTPHDLRRTAATHLGAMGYGNDQIGRLLNHVDGTVTAVYNRHKYNDLIQKMLSAWEKRLQKILLENSPEKTACQEAMS